MPCQVQHLVIVAGPTASGKSTLIREVCEGRLPELGDRVGVQHLHEWPRSRAPIVGRLAKPCLGGLIIHWDFIYTRFGHGADSHVLRLLEQAHEVSFVSVWTAPERLARQLIEGKLRNRIAQNAFELAKSAVFQRLPSPLIVWAATPLSRWLPRSLFKHHYSCLELCARPRRLVQAYRCWFEFCDRHIDKNHRHFIVEFDSVLRFHSRDEWEHIVGEYVSAQKSA